MRSNEKITAALLVAALAAAGCSKGDDTSQTKVEPEHSARPVQVSMINNSPASGRGIDNPTKITGPVSFADGEAAYKAGNYSDAMNVFEQYTIEKPENAWGHYMLGLSSWKSGDPTKAERAFEDALSIDPNHMKSLVNLSRVLIEQGRFDDALTKLTLAGEIDSDSTEVHRLLGRTYAAQGKIEDAEHAYRRAIELDDKDAWSMNNLALLFVEQGRANDALPLLAKAVELRKDVAIFHNNLGMALEHTGRFIAAAGEYRGALEADPAYDKAKRNLERVEAVKVDSEEPFDLEGTAKSVGEDQTPKPADTATPAE